MFCTITFTSTSLSDIFSPPLVRKTLSDAAFCFWLGKKKFNGKGTTFAYQGLVKSTKVFPSTHHKCS